MDIQHKLNDLKDQKSYSIPAKRTMEHLKPILSKSNDLRQRWMWELLQNASDLGSNIKAKFEITDQHLTFFHNAKPFTLSEAYNLIMPDSTKDEEELHNRSVIGQFGTGFISTHILSKLIHIKGIVEEDSCLYNFNFHLNRSERNDKEFLIQSIKDAEVEYRESLEEIDELPEDEFQTSFTYYINNTYSSLDGQEIVSDGIESFKKLIPYALAFRPELVEVEIIDRRTTPIKLTFKRKVVESDIEDLIIIKTVCFQNGEHVKNRLIGKIIDEKTEIAFPIREIEENTFKLLPFPRNCPRLFCAFPMIGTSEFNFPVVIHSENFVPNRERDGIEITEFDEENRERLIEGTNAFQRLLEIVEENEWTNAFNICRFKRPQFNDEDTQIWLIESIYAPIKNGIYNTKLIELDGDLEVDDYRIKLADAFIPYVNRRVNDKKEVVNRIHNFAFQVKPEQIPAKETTFNWYEALNFSVFEDAKLDLESLCEIISSNGKLNDFAEPLNMSKEEALNYLTGLVSFIIEQEKTYLLNDYNLVINQNNRFTTIDGLKLDRTGHKGMNDGFNNKLKTIYYELSQEGCRWFLLHPKFEVIEGLIKNDNTYDFKELSKDTDEQLRNYEGNFHDEDFLQILKKLFDWYSNCGLSNDTLTNMFPYFSSNKSQIYLNTKTPEELEYAFDIEISGKSKVLAKLANSSISQEDLEIISENTELVSSIIEWINSKHDDNPDKELGNIGEEFLYHKLCEVFGEARVIWDNKAEYDFRVLKKDLAKTKYYIDAKTTAKGLGNSDNVPFYMRTAQWNFLDEKQARDKYIIARVFKNDDALDVKYLRLNAKSL